jgi:hypothetical protein
MSPKGEKLARFFRKLARDPDLYRQYLADPEGVMRAEGLDEDVIQAVMDGNLAFLNEQLRDSNLICGTIVRANPQ